MVFLIVAGVVSGALDFAARRARAAERAAAQAETLSALAGGDLDEESSLKEVLERARDAFQMESVVLRSRERPTERWVDVERSGWAPPGQEAPLRFDVPISPRLRLVGRGPALFAEDQRVLAAFAAAAQTAYEARLLSARARQAQSLAVADRQRTALLGTVGRELRAPVTEIAAAVSGLRGNEGEREELFDAIEAAAARLERVAGDLFEASRLQSGALTVDARPVALDDVIHAAFSTLRASAQRVHVDVPPDLPAVRADPALLERVIANLLDDALRHADSVGITAVAATSSVRVEMVAHGSTAAQHGREPGLALAVAQGLIEAVGGALVADSAAEGGATVRLRLALAERGRVDEPV